MRAFVILAFVALGCGSSSKPLFDLPCDDCIAPPLDRPVLHGVREASIYDVAALRWRAIEELSDVTVRTSEGCKASVDPRASDSTSAMIRVRAEAPVVCTVRLSGRVSGSYLSAEHVIEFFDVDALREVEEPLSRECSFWRVELERGIWCGLNGDSWFVPAGGSPQHIVGFALAGQLDAHHAVICHQYTCEVRSDDGTLATTFRTELDGSYQTVPVYLDRSEVSYVRASGSRYVLRRMRWKDGGFESPVDLAAPWSATTRFSPLPWRDWLVTFGESEVAILDAEANTVGRIALPRSFSFGRYGGLFTLAIGGPVHLASTPDELLGGTGFLVHGLARAPEGTTLTADVGPDLVTPTLRLIDTSGEAPHVVALGQFPNGETIPRLAPGTAFKTRSTFGVARSGITVEWNDDTRTRLARTRVRP